MLVREQEQIRNTFHQAIWRKQSELKAAVAAANDKAIDAVLAIPRWAQLQTELDGLGMPPDSMRRIINREGFGLGLRVDPTMVRDIDADLARAGYVPFTKAEEFVTWPEYIAMCSALIYCKKKWHDIQPLVYGFAADLAAATDTAGCKNAAQKFADGLAS